MKPKLMPNQSASLVNNQGQLVEPWRTYLDKQPGKADLVSDLPATPTTTQISTAFNALLAGLKAAGLMEKT